MLAASNIRITPIALVGWLIVISGGLIRFVSSHALGNQFTFELSMRKDHKLITSGPYSVVRHPAYMGLMLSMLGYFPYHWSGGSWLIECSGLSFDVGRVLISADVMGSVYMAIVLVARTYKEDAMLRKKFDEWNQWAGEVPWKLVPFVY